MIKKNLFFLCVCGFLGFSVLSLAQFLPEEVAEWPKWEEFLQTANITGSVQMSGAEAVTSP